MPSICFSNRWIHPGAHFLSWLGDVKVIQCGVCAGGSWYKSPASCAVPVLDGQESMLHEAGRVDVYLCTFKRTSTACYSNTKKNSGCRPKCTIKISARACSEIATMPPLRCLL